jgi:multidrug efflux pump
MNITFRDIASGGAIRNVPISSLVHIDYTSTLGSVKRKNQKACHYPEIQCAQWLYADRPSTSSWHKSIADFKKKLPEGVTIKQTGEGEQQAETGAFLGGALVIALVTILIILVLQFNSVGKSVIILNEILFSVIGVILGFAITKMQVSVIMTGLGIVGLAGIVVKNGILVIEFTDELRSAGMKTREAAIEAERPVSSPCC